MTTTNLWTSATFEQRVQPFFKAATKQDKSRFVLAEELLSRIERQPELLKNYLAETERSETLLENFWNVAFDSEGDKKSRRRSVTLKRSEAQQPFFNACERLVHLICTHELLKKTHSIVPLYDACIVWMQRNELPVPAGDLNCGHELRSGDRIEGMLSEILTKRITRLDLRETGVDFQALSDRLMELHSSGTLPLERLTVSDRNDPRILLTWHNIQKVPLTITHKRLNRASQAADLDYPSLIIREHLIKKAHHDADLYARLIATVNKSGLAVPMMDLKIDFAVIGIGHMSRQLAQEIESHGITHLDTDDFVTYEQVILNALRILKGRGAALPELALPEYYDPTVYFVMQDEGLLPKAKK